MYPLLLRTVKQVTKTQPDLGRRIHDDRMLMGHVLNLVSLYNKVRAKIDRIQVTYSIQVISPVKSRLATYLFTNTAHQVLPGIPRYCPQSV